MRDTEFDTISSTHLETYLAQALVDAKYDLGSSYSDVLDLSILQNLAGADDFETWRNLDFGYTDPDGSELLRFRISQLYSGLSNSHVVCCTGAHDAAACVAEALLTREDHAIVVLPLYQPLEWTITDRVAATGISLDAENLRLDLNHLEAAITPRTRVVMMNFPNSPTGVMLDDETLNGVVALCRRHGLWLINDEVYRHLVSGRPATPIIDLYERGVSIDAVTKGYGLPGLRVGWVACHDVELLRRVSLVKARRSSFLAAPSNVLASIALANRIELLAHARMIGVQNRTYLHDTLSVFSDFFDLDSGSNLLFSCPRYLGPDGAVGFANRLLARTGAIVLPTALWKSPLAPVPQDRIRIGLGLGSSAKGLEVLAEYLCTRHFVDA